MMKNFPRLMAAAAVSLLLTGCGLYDKYESQAVAPADAFGTGEVIADASTNGSLADVSWREFFTDPLLQELIDSVLARNTDLNSARIAIEQSEASLKAAKLAYLPSLYFNPSGTLSSFDFGPVSKTYNLPLQLNWDVDIFASITNKKRAANAVLLQAQVRDRQLDILTQTDSLWGASLDIQKVLWENGKSFSTAVNQMESSYLSVKTQVVDVRRNIRSVENALCRLLCMAPQHIQRSYWGSSALPEHSEASTGQRMFDPKFIMIGVPAQLLENRPDIRMADLAMEEAFYNTQTCSAGMYRLSLMPAIR